jgi:hypothetical protein
VDRIGAFASAPRIYLALPIPRGPLDQDANYRRVRDETGRVAVERKLPVIDFWTAFLGRPELFQDPTHLTIPGRPHAAQVAAAVVTRQP